MTVLRSHVGPLAGYRHTEACWLVMGAAFTSRELFDSATCRNEPTRHGVIMEYGRAFSVEVPEWRDATTAADHADETCRVFQAYFLRANGVYIRDGHGRFEVRALAPSSVDMVRSILVDHEGLIISDEWQIPAGLLGGVIASE